MQSAANQAIETDFHAPKIVNVVGTFTLDVKENLKLGDIASRWNNSRYNKARFSGLVARNQDPKATFMIFSNGKVNVTGARSENQCQLSCTKLIKKMNRLGVLKSLRPKVQFKVQNVVAMVSTKLSINLQLMSNKQSRYCSFVPQSFPGLIYRMAEPKATFLVFSTGKVVMVGVQSENKVMPCFRVFYKILKKYKITNHTFPRPQNNN